MHPHSNVVSQVSILYDCRIGTCIMVLWKTSPTQIMVGTHCLKFRLIHNINALIAGYVTYRFDGLGMWLLLGFCCMCWLTKYSMARSVCRQPTAITFLLMEHLLYMQKFLVQFLAFLSRLDKSHA